MSAVASTPDEDFADALRRAQRRTLTARQTLVLETIANLTSASGGMSPTLRELGRALGKTVTAALTTRAEAAPKPGGKREGAGRPLLPQAAAVAESKQRVTANNHRDDGNHESSARGNSEAYLAARIARDAPAVHEAMKAGKYPSVRAAAKAAGIVKPPNPARAAATAFAKVPFEQVAAFVALLDGSRLKPLAACIKDRIGGAS